MKFHVQFLEHAAIDKEILVDAIGSDGVFILDGRNNLRTMVEDAKERMHQLRNVRSFAGFAIREGSRFGECRCIYTGGSNE